MFDDLSMRIMELTFHLRQDYSGHDDDVRMLITDARAAIQTEFGQVPAWEEEELLAADTYVTAKWLMAALAAVSKAILVSQLSDDEYWGGYCYTKPKAQRTARRIAPTR